MQNEIPIQSLNGAPRFLDLRAGTLHSDSGAVVARLAEPKERRVTMDLSVADVQAGADALLELHGDQAEGAADTLAPIHEVKHEHGSAFVQDPSDAVAQVLPAGIAYGGAWPALASTLRTTPFQTVPIGLGCVLPSEVIANADFDLTRAQLARLVQAHQLAREVRVAALLGVAATWATANANSLAAGDKWNGGATSDPVGDIEAMMAASYLPITHLAMDERTAITFHKDARVTAFFQALAASGARTSFPKIVISKMKKLSSGAPTYVLGGAVIGVRSPTDAALLSTAVTARWSIEDRETHAGETYSKVAGFELREFIASDRGPRGARELVMLAPDAEIVTALNASAKAIVGGVIVGAYQ